MQRALEAFCVALLLAGCLIGGSNEPGRLLLMIPQLVSLPLLGMALTLGIRATAPIAFRVAAMVLVLPLLQLIPLPPQLWTVLPGRASAVEAYATAGVEIPWLPLSLTPGATMHFWLGLLPAVSLFLAIPHLTIDARRRLMHVAILLGVLDVLLGLAQVAGGPASPIRLYATASRVDAVGFFANRNHQATFLAMLLLLAGALAAGRRRAALERIWLAAAGGLLLLGIAASGSRAGLALGLGATLGIAWTLGSPRIDEGKARSILIGGGVVVGLIALPVLILQSHAGSLADDLRWEIAGTTWRAIVNHFPVGAGFGSFEPIYAQVEQPDKLFAAIVNNAHDDWLEVTLEGGFVGMILLAAALAYLIRETVAAHPEAVRSAFTRATLTATLAALWLCALHEVVDYPLRTMAVNVVLSLVCGLRAAALGDARQENMRRTDEPPIRATPVRQVDHRRGDRLPPRGRNPIARAARGA